MYLLIYFTQMTTKMMVTKILVIITKISKYYKDGADDYIDDEVIPHEVQVHQFCQYMIYNIQYRVHNINIDDDLDPT